MKYFYVPKKMMQELLRMRYEVAILIPKNNQYQRFQIQSHHQGKWLHHKNIFQ